MKKYGFSFSWKRAIGISQAKSRLSRKLGVPLTQSGRQRKIGRGLGCCMVLGILSLSLFGPVFWITTAKTTKISSSSNKTVHVKEHINKSGKTVKAHDRTLPNKSKDDNWSTKGNVNPKTGKHGTVDPDKKK